MSRERYYILYPAESVPYNTDIYYTTNPLILTQYLRQNEEVEYDVIEMVGDDIFDISEKLMKKYHKAIDQGDKLEVYTTHNGLSVIISDQDMNNYDIYSVVDAINKILVEGWYRLKVLLPYFKDEYKEFLNIYVVLLYKYICRQVLACECDLNSDVSYETLKLLGFDVIPHGYVEQDEVIDDILMLYILELGWGCLD